MIGLPCDIPNHASYLQSWIAVLKQDRREIFRAAAEAQRMADYILGFHPDYSETPSESSDVEDEGATSIAPLLAAGARRGESAFAADAHDRRQAPITGLDKSNGKSARRASS